MFNQINCDIIKPLLRKNSVHRTCINTKNIILNEKKALHKRVNTVRVHLYEVLKLAKLIYGEKKPPWIPLAATETGKG